jgi:hypothetical protein
MEPLIFFSRNTVLKPLALEDSRKNKEKFIYIREVVANLSNSTVKGQKEK